MRLTSRPLMERQMTRKFKFGKFGMKEDPRYAHVTLAYQGRDLLGEVIGVRFDEVCGCFRLTIRHFCGDLWPIEPSATAVNVLVRD